MAKKRKKKSLKKPVKKTKPKTAKSKAAASVSAVRPPAGLSAMTSLFAGYFGTKTENH